MILSGCPPPTCPHEYDSVYPVLIPLPSLSQQVNFGLRKQQVSGSVLGIVGVNEGMPTNVKCCTALNNADTMLFLFRPSNCQHVTFVTCSSGNPDQQAPAVTLSQTNLSFLCPLLLSYIIPLHNPSPSTFNILYP